MSRREWTLDLDSENQHLIPWLESEPDRQLREAIARYLSDLVRAPMGRGVEESPGVFSATVRVNMAHGRIGVLVWTLDPELRLVHLAVVRSEGRQPGRSAP